MLSASSAKPKLRTSTHNPKQLLRSSLQPQRPPGVIMLDMIMHMTMVRARQSRTKSRKRMTTMMKRLMIVVSRAKTSSLS